MEEYRESSNSRSDLRSVDPDVVRGEISKINFEINYSPSTYANEVKTTNYTAGIFDKGINAAKNTWESIKDIANKNADNMYVDLPQSVVIGKSDKTWVNIRSGPGTSYNGNGQLNQSEEFEIVDNVQITTNDGNIEDWVRIKRKNGQEGYVRRDLINIFDTETN